MEEGVIRMPERGHDADVDVTDDGLDGSTRGVSDALAETIMAAMVEIVVHVCDPLSVLLFGSRARGDHKPWSDIDLLVIMPNGVDTWRVEVDISRALPLRSALWPDLYVTTRAILAMHGRAPFYFYCYALHDRRVLYKRRSHERDRQNAYVVTRRDDADEQADILEELCMDLDTSFLLGEY